MASIGISFESEIKTAIEKDDDTSLQQLLQETPRGVNTKVSWGDSLLHTAIKVDGSTKMVSCLLDSNIDLSATDKYGWTALHLAARKNKVDLCILLLNNGADPNGKNRLNETPLHLAAELGYKDIVDILLDNGANVDIKESNGKTAVDLCDNVEVKELLRVHQNNQRQAHHKWRQATAKSSYGAMSMLWTIIFNIWTIICNYGFHGVFSTGDLKAAVTTADLAECTTDLTERFLKDARCMKIVRADLQMCEEEDFLGSGAYGKCYRAQCAKLGSKTVVVKIIENTRLTNDQEKRVLARKEARAMVASRHPNIVEMYGLMMDWRSSWYGVVIEYMRYGSLLELRQKVSIPEGLQVYMMLGIAQAVCYLHVQDDTKPGLVHSDIKLDNILINENFQAKLGDFGVAQLQELTATTHRIKGTVSHTAPELFCPDLVGLSLPEYSPETDVWSYGITLYELLKGETPLHGHSDFLIKENVMKGIQKPCRKELKACQPSALVTMAIMCLEKQPCKRPTFEKISSHLKNEYDVHHKSDHLEDITKLFEGLQHYDDKLSSRQQALRKNRALFTEDLDPPDVYDYLNQEGVITSEEVELVEKTGVTRKGKVRKLLDLILMRDDRAIDVLCMALRRSGQTHLADAMMES